MMTTFSDEEYESICAAISMIDATYNVLDATYDDCDDMQILHEMRNRMNERRLELLGNGKAKPWHVSELMEARK